MNENTQEITLDEKNIKEDKLYAGKYKNPEELEKGYKELSTLVRAKHPTAPEEYDFSNIEGIDNENPLLNNMQEVMKNHNLTQQQATALTEAFVSYNSHQLPNIEEEVKKLGADAPIMVQQVEGFMKRYLNEEESSLLSQLGCSADGIKLLYKLSKQSGEKSIPASSTSSINTIGDLRQKAEKMLQDKNLRNNPEKQEEYDAIWQKIASLEG